MKLRIVMGLDCRYWVMKTLISTKDILYIFPGSHVWRMLTLHAKETKNGPCDVNKWCLGCDSARKTDKVPY